MSDSTVAPRTQLLVGGGLLAYPALVVAAIAGAAWPFAVLGLASLAIEAILQSRAPGISWYLSRGGFGWTVRSSIRSLAVIVLAATASGISHRQFVMIALGMAVIEGGRAIYSLATTYAKIRRLPGVLTRNIDLSALKIPSLGYGPFEHISARATTGLGLLPLLGLAGWQITGHGDVAVVATLVGAVIALVTAIAIGVATIRAVRLPSERRMLAEVRRQVVKIRPEIVLYFSGSIDSLYQINMWLDTITALPYRTVILMRERANLALMAPTSLPVVAMPAAVDLMSFDLPSVAVAMYAANTGKNIHYLRLPGMIHVFIGHGDSDKIASVNPFSKAYDEIWVAGKAGRDRYARAAVGVQDTDIIEVGRPQLAPIRHTNHHIRTGVFTVLYAPTWEGWTDDAQNTSLTAMGPTIIAKLLAHPAGIRVIYKPHPFTGTRDPKTLTASHTITTMIDTANTGLPTPDPDQTAAQQHMAALRTQIAAIGHDEHAADELEAARNSGHAHPDYAAQATALTTEWNTAYWASQPPEAHRTVTDPLAALFDCFNQADLLITDISSVVADYLYSEKPYVVANSSDLPDPVFRDRYPTASAAYLLSTDCTELDPTITDLTTGIDPRRHERQNLKTYLLGLDEPDAGDRFARAVDEAIKRASTLARDADAFGQYDTEPEADTSGNADN